MESINDLKILAAAVLNEYGIKADEIAVIQSGTIKTVWKIKSGQDVYCLKRLKQSLDKVMFSVNAQIYIYKKGGNVPGVYMSSLTEPVVKLNDQLFVLYEWLSGRDLSFENNKEFIMALEGLANFHTFSKGYISGEGARTSTKLGKWPNQYESMKKRIIGWKEAAASKSSPSHTAFLSNADSMIYLADQAILLLNQSSYASLTSPDSNVPVLCHQDFGKGNALLCEKGVIVIDLDSVTFDLPARDLRKIIGKTATTIGKWDRRQIDEVVNCYTNINPMTDDEKKVLYIDLIFPHWFFGLVKNQFDKMKELRASEIERIARIENSKLTVLKELLER